MDSLKGSTGQYSDLQCPATKRLKYFKDTIYKWAIYLLVFVGQCSNQHAGSLAHDRSVAQIGLLFFYWHVLMAYVFSDYGKV